LKGLCLKKKKKFARSTGEEKLSKIEKVSKKETTRRIENKKEKEVSPKTK